jgi:hypothetical protein
MRRYTLYDDVGSGVGRRRFLAKPGKTGAPAPLKQWVSVAVPTLVMAGTVLIGREESHAFMRHGADALADALPNAQRRTLDGQDQGPSHEAPVSVLVRFFTGLTCHPIDRD